MVVATIASSGAIAAKQQIEAHGLSNQHASWFRIAAPKGPFTKFEAAASASTPSSGLQHSESVMPIPLRLARTS
mgnify:CR=1 FL=1